MSEIKVKNFKGNLSDCVLVLEGGAFRGIYTAGVLDYFLEHGLFINTVYGVSAGALTATNYMAGCFGRSAELMISERFNKDYIGFRALIEQGSVIGFDFMFEEMDKKFPLNKEELFREDKTLNIVTTNVKSGEPEYFTNHLDEEKFYKALRASASLPLVSRMVDIDGEYYLDGGIATKIPIRVALNEGHRKIIFIGTRDSSYRRKSSPKELELVKIHYRHYPKFVEAYANANENYNKDCDMIDDLVRNNKIMRITPSRKVEVSRLERDVNKLIELYKLGYTDAMERFEEIIEYIKK